MKWFKCSNTIALNPKLGMAAQYSKCYKHEVIACWLYFLADASRNNDKGNLGNIDFDAIDYALDFTPTKSKKIFDALCAKGLIANNAIVGWLEYQADPTNAERQRKYREKSKHDTNAVTDSNSYITPSNEVTPEEKRGEEKRIDNIKPKKYFFDSAYYKTLKDKQIQSSWSLTAEEKTFMQEYELNQVKQMRKL